MTNSFYTIQITDNNLYPGFLGVAIKGEAEQISITNFVNASSPTYQQCEIGSDIEQTIINLKSQLENYHIGAGFDQTIIVTITAIDTLKVELIESYSHLDVVLGNGLESNTVLSISNTKNIKYYIEYNDTENFLHRFELYDPNYDESPIEVSGSVIMDYGQVDENLEAIRGQGLRVDLDADVTLTFEDLFSEQQKTLSVIYYREGVVLFQGWLNSEGYYEDYVNDKWNVSFDCIDGLGYLSDLAFVDSDGLNIVGVKTQLEVLSLALRRTGIEQDINLDIDVFYTGLADTESILENVNVNTRRYIKDDDETVMDCEEVIRDILEPYGAVLTSYNGQWAIYKPNQIALNPVATFFRYDYLGIALSPTTVTFDFSLDLGSQSDGFYPHYGNGNQRFTNKSSFGAYRISYKYGLLKSLIDNENLFTADGSTYDDFTILDNTNLTIPSAGGYGLGIDSVNVGDILEQIETNNITIGEGSEINLNISVTPETPIDDGSSVLIFAKASVVGASSTVYYDRSSGLWDGNSNSVALTGNINSSTSFVFEESFSAAPIDGELSVVFLTPRKTSVSSSVVVNYSTISVSVNNTGNSNILGEIFTFERTINPSSRIEKTREVLTGDSDLDIYQGTLYQADGITPTETWYRKGFTEAVPILEMMGAETMRMNAKTMRIFSGDVYGYFPYLSVLSIDQRDGLFGVTKYSYDTKRNIISAEFKQMFSDELTDLDVEKQLDYGNVVEPTIRG